MKNKVLVTVLLTIVINIGYTQNFKIKDRLNLNIGYSKYSPVTNIYNIGETYTVDLLLKSELSFQINDLLSVGLIYGYSPITYYQFTERDNDYTHISYTNDRYVKTYGLNVTYFFFQHLINQSKLRFTPYCKLNLEKGSYRNPLFTDHKPYNYGAFIGSNFYFGKKWGIYGEYGFGKYSNFTYGLSFKF